MQERKRKDRKKWQQEREIVKYKASNEERHALTPAHPRSTQAHMTGLSRVSKEDSGEVFLGDGLESAGELVELQLQHFCLKILHEFVEIFETKDFFAVRPEKMDQ